MKTIVIVVAMDKELLTFKSYLEDLQEQDLNNKKIYVGKLGKYQIILSKSGIGKVSSAIILTMLIEKYHPSLVINMGIAGGYKRILKTLDSVIVTKALYSDVNMLEDAYTDLAYGQLEDMPPYFEIDESLQKQLHLIVPSNVYFGTALSGDQFVTSYDKCQALVDKYFSKYDVLTFDMETASVFHTCYLYKLPCLVIRTISDLIGSSDALDYGVFSVKASEIVGHLCKNIIEKIEI